VNITGAHDCDDIDDPCEMDSFWILWGVGGDSTTYNGDFAVPMGGEDGPGYIRLEVHYYNPNRLASVIDQSGLTLTYTSHLRKYDLGVLTLGSEAIQLPPHEPYLEVVNDCQETCTSRIPGAITIVGLAPHMHLTGSMFWIQLIRNGTETEEFFRDDYYDFTQQHFFDLNRIILPSDRLITHCVYDTTDRTTVTKGGAATTDEMCFAFISYYPKMKIGTCIDLTGASPKYNNTVYCEDQQDPRNSIISGTLPRPSYVKFEEKKLECKPEKEEVTAYSVVGRFVWYVVIVIGSGLLIAYCMKSKYFGQKLFAGRWYNKAPQNPQTEKGVESVAIPLEEVSVNGAIITSEKTENVENA